MTAATQLNLQRQGALTVGIGVLVLSFDALLIRLSDADAWNVAFWRGALIALSLLSLLVISRQRGALRRLFGFGLPALFSASLQGAGSILFVLAISTTSVANTVVLIATAPLFAAIASHFLLGEQVAPRTWAACVLVLTGVTLVFGSSMDLNRTTGDLYALGGAIALGGNLSILRRHPDLPRIPLVAFSGLLIAGFALPFGNPLQLEPHSYAVLALMGLLQMPLALVLITAGTRYLTAPEVSLFLLLETLLGPVWVWLALGETVSGRTLTGGAVIVFTLLIHGWMQVRAIRGGRH